MARRSYGTGRLFARADSGGREHWYGSWWAGGTRVKRRLGLKRRPGSSDGLTRTQAEAELRRRIATDVVVAGPARRTVGEAGEAYVAHLEHVMERKRTTIADYRGYLRKCLAPFFGGVPLDRIDRARVEAYLHAKKREGLSAKTIQNHLNFLHGIWVFSIKRQRAVDNPVALVDRPKAPRSAHRRIRFLTNEQLEALLRAVPADELGPLERAIYLCAALTGLRQGELLALRWCDVDWTARRVRVSESFTRGAFDTPKSHRGRSVPMADRLAGELERHFQRSRWRDDRDLVFAHPLTSSPYDPSKLRKRYARGPGARRPPAADLPRAAPHLRHPDGGGRRPAPRDPALDGPRRPVDDGDLRALLARPDRARRARRAGVRRRLACHLTRRSPPASRPLGAVLGRPALEVLADEAHVLADAHAGQLAAAHRVAHPARAHGQQRCRLRRGQQWLGEVDGRAVDGEVELVAHRSAPVAVGCFSVARDAGRPPVQSPREPAREPPRELAEVLRRGERLQELLIVELGRALRAPRGDLPLDEQPEVLAHRPLAGRRAEGPPRLVTHPHARHLRLHRRRVGDPPSCSSSHAPLSRDSAGTPRRVTR
jgi:integrase